MIPRVIFDGDYKETCFESSDDYISDNNSYSNIGLSLNSQELIRELHQALYKEETHQKRFEEIVHSILDDIQKYKRDYKKLEVLFKKEKERYDESIKQMMDEAEQQLYLSTDKAKTTERLEAEKLIERLKKQHETEITSLQMSLNRMILLEKKYHEDKSAEEYRQNEFKKEIQNINDEKRNLNLTLLEYQTQITVLRSEISSLKAYATEKDVNRQIIIHLGRESTVLKNEINILQETNKRLNDTNDILLSEITNLKTKLAKKRLNSDQELSSYITSTPTEKYAPFNINQYSYMRTKINESYETDDEEYDLTTMDSGIWQLHNNSLFEDLSIKTQINVSNNNTLTIPPVIKDSIFSSFNKSIPSKNKPDFSFKLVIAGDSYVGKTSLIKKYCKEEFSSSTSATLKNDSYTKLLLTDNKKDVQLELWDTCGHEKFSSIDKSYFRRVDGFVLMYDVTCEQSFNNIRRWIRVINETCDKIMPILIIGNKTDVRDSATKNNIKVIQQKQGAQIAWNNRALFIETSVKDGTNIDGSLSDLCKIMTRNQELDLKYFLYYFS